MAWYVYMLRCGDGTLYTGMTDDVQRRLDAHRAGKGAKYTRGDIIEELNRMSSAMHIMMCRYLAGQYQN